MSSVSQSKGSTNDGLFPFGSRSDARRQPQELDLVESFAQGRISRRSFIKRATIVGLSLPTISMIIAACSTPATSGAPSAAASAGRLGRRERSARLGSGRRHDPHRHPATRSARPGRHAGPRRLRARRPVVRVPRGARPGHLGHRPGPRRVVGAERRQQRLDVQAPRRASSGRTARTSPPTTSSPRWVASSPPATPASRASSTRTRPRPSTRRPSSSRWSAPTATSRTSSRCSTPRPSSRRRLRDRHDPRRDARTGPVPGSSRPTTWRPARGFVRNDAWWGGTTPLDAVEYTFFDETGPMVTAYQGGQIDAIVQFDVFSGTAAVQRRELPGQRGADHQPPPDLVPHRHRPVHRQARPPGRRPVAGPRRDGPAAVPGPRRGRQRPRHLLALSVLRPGPSRSGRATSSRPRPLLSEAGVTGLTADAPRRRAPGDPGPRGAHPEPGGRSRDHPDPGGRVARHVLRRPVVPGGAGRPALLRRGRARHRRLRPPLHAGRVPQLGAQDERRLELVAVLARRTSTPRSPSSRRRSASTPRRRPARRSRPILNEDVAVAIPYIYSFLSGNAKTFTGVYSSALGQMFVQAASKVG